MKEMTYDDLARLSGCSVQQVKRRALLLFENDPEVKASYPCLAGGRGVKRGLRPNDAFKVLLALKLEKYKVDLTEANHIVMRIINEMSSMEIGPGKAPMDVFPSALLTSQTIPPRIVVRIHPGLVCEFRIYENSDPLYDHIQEEASIGINWKLLEEGPCYVRFVPEMQRTEVVPGLESIFGEPVFHIELTHFLILFLQELLY